MVRIDPAEPTGRSGDQALREITGVVEGVPLGVLSTDGEGVVLSANQRAADVLGWASDLLRGTSVFDLFTDRDRARDLLHESGGGVEATSQVLERAAAPGPRFIEATAVRQPSSGPPWIVVVRDVTVRVAEEGRAATEAGRRYLELVQSPDAIVWEMDAASGSMTFISRRAETVLGYPAREWLTDDQFWRRVVHPDDLPRILGLRDQRTPGESHHQLEYRATAKDGRAVWLRGVFRFVGDDDQRPARIYGVSVDVTELKRAEEAGGLQKTLLESQSEATIDGILVVSPSGEMISFNRRFVEMWGIPGDVVETRSDEQALRSVLDKLVDPDEFLARVAYLYAHPDEESREEIALRDGRTFDRWSSPLRSSDGVYYGRAWYFRDITERKRAEEALRESRKHFAFLADASTLLAASLDVRTVLERVAELVVPVLADWCCIDMLTEDGSIERVAVTHADSARAEQAERLKEFPPDPEGTDARVQALRAGRSLLTPHLTDEQLKAHARDDEHLRIMRGLGYGSSIVVPLQARGRTLAVMTLVQAESGRTYGAEHLGLAEDIARRAALAADSARLYQRQRFVAQSLQNNLLPRTLPEIPGAEVAARYYAVGEGVEVGGDFYDVFPTGDSSWAVLIGDVSGKGADAASVTAMARYTLRVAARRSRKPSRALAVLNEAMLEESTRHFCTVAFANVQLSDDGLRLSIACGGHPLPLVLRGDGSIENVGRPGTLLGLFPDPDLRDKSVDLHPGDILLLYTDGVTEARSASATFGEGMLRHVLGSCVGVDAPEVARRIERAVLDFQGADPRDDIALLVLRVPR